MIGLAIQLIVDEFQLLVNDFKPVYDVIFEFFLEEDNQICHIFFIAKVVQCNATNKNI